MELFSLLTPIVAAEAGSLKALAAIGAGMVIIGAALGIGAIGSRACEAIGRQPEAKGAIQGAMIISAALIEGATFFALVIAMMAL